MSRLQRFAAFRGALANFQQDFAAIPASSGTETVMTWNKATIEMSLLLTLAVMDALLIAFAVAPHA